MNVVLLAERPHVFDEGVFTEIGDIDVVLDDVLLIAQESSDTFREHGVDMDFVPARGIGQSHDVFLSDEERLEHQDRTVRHEPGLGRDFAVSEERRITHLDLVGSVVHAGRDRMARRC